MDNILQEIDQLIANGRYPEAACRIRTSFDILEKALTSLSELDEIDLEQDLNRQYVAFALNYGGFSVDIGFGMNDEPLVRSGIITLKAIKERVNASHPYYVDICYNIGNGLTTLAQWKQHSSPHHYPVGDSDLEEAKKLYREALQLTQVEDKLKKQLLVNYGNLLHGRLGRTLEAFEAYDQALAIDPDFEMALANKAYIQFLFARTVDSKDGFILLHEAYILLKRALAGKMEFGPRNYFEGILGNIIRMVPAIEKLGDDISCRKKIKKLKNPFQDFYRSFCHTERLYLNPLGRNHTCEAALCDPILFKGMIANTEEPDVPYKYAAYINMIKQEYVFARFQAAQSFFKDPNLAFLDKGVTQINTLDYPVYNIFIEQAKSAFRSSISILDKVAFVVNEYMELGLNPKRIYFHSIASLDAKTGSSLMERLRPLQNPYAAALIDLANDFNNGHFKFLKELRNEFEHRFRSIHFYAVPSPFSTLTSSAEILGSDEFRTQMVDMLRVVKAAIFYLVMMIDWEESSKKANTDPSTIAMLLFSNISDEFKKE